MKPITRRDFGRLAALSALGVALPVRGQEQASSVTARIYVGTFTEGPNAGIYQGKSLGIYRLSLNVQTGMLTPEGEATVSANPTYLTTHPSGRFLYAVNEVAEIDGQPGGGMSAFAIAPETGDLEMINQVSTQGTWPCFVAVEPTGRVALVANYLSGSVCVLPIESDGRLGEVTDIVQYEGSGADPQRQEGPHAHCIVPDAAGSFVFSADLGTDRLMAFGLDADRGKLIPHEIPFVKSVAGSGPRIFRFHPSGKWGYLLHELDSTLVVFSYDSKSGTLQEMQTLSTLPKGHGGPNWAADIQVSPEGDHVYTSNRGNDTIAVFSVDLITGLLELVEYEPSRGIAPRSFAFEPEGRFAVVANQFTNDVLTLARDPSTGLLSLPMVPPLTVYCPSCICIPDAG